MVTCENNFVKSYDYLVNCYNELKIKLLYDYLTLDGFFAQRYIQNHTYLGKQSFPVSVGYCSNGKLRKNIFQKYDNSYLASKEVS